MFQSLYKYLVLYKKVTVPGLGVFYLERIAAKLDFVNKIFVAPTAKIGFKHDVSANDTYIYTFLSHEQTINLSEATNLYNDFAHNLKESLTKHQTIELPGIGVLSQSREGELNFKETAQINCYFPPASAERVLRENTEHHILVGSRKRTNKEMKKMLFKELEASSQDNDYWWIFAIALGLIGIATIVYYYLNNGTIH